MLVQVFGFVDCSNVSLFNALTGDNTDGAHKKKETGFLGLNRYCKNSCICICISYCCDR